MKDLILNMVIRKQEGRYSAWCPELDVASEGNTIEEAKESLKEALQCHVETMIEEGDTPLLLEKLGLTEKEFKKDTLVSETFSGTLEVPISL